MRFPPFKGEEEKVPFSPFLFFSSLLHDAWPHLGGETQPLSREGGRPMTKEEEEERKGEVGGGGGGGGQQEDAGGRGIRQSDIISFFRGK